MDEVTLTQALVCAASPSGREAPAAQVFQEALAQLGLHSHQDEAGNVIGTWVQGDGPTVMLCGHLDTVPVGDEALWPHPPLAGVVADGAVWGRGSCDMKGALAAMALAARDAAEQGVQGTLVVAGVVQEEVGGLGARYLASHHRADVVILGEPSDLKLMLGHRGRIEIEARLPGRIAHAAKSELGDNALYRAAELLLALRDLDLPQGGPLGGSSLTPTRLTVTPNSINVVPGSATLTIDYRNLPGDEPEAVLARLQALAPEASFTIPVEEARSETGRVVMRLPRIMPPYLTPGENRWVTTARYALREVLTREGLSYHEGCWWFGTDAPHLAAMGAPVIGFGPGRPELAHTTAEHVPTSHLRLARRAYAALIASLLKE